MNLSVDQETFITTCDNDKIKTQSAYPSPTPTVMPTPEPYPCPGVECNEGSGIPIDNCSHAGGCPTGWFSTGQCCQPFTPSPILIDIDGSGLHLTDATTGVFSISSASDNSISFPGQHQVRQTHFWYSIGMATGRSKWSRIVWQLNTSAEVNRRQWISGTGAI
jgi:hypothetical protein